MASNGIDVLHLSARIRPQLSVWLSIGCQPDVDQLTYAVVSSILRADRTSNANHSQQATKIAIG
jgi:hypothetical protein